jgi:translation initiation factor IF-3
MLLTLLSSSAQPNWEVGRNLATDKVTEFRPHPAVMSRDGAASPGRLHQVASAPATAGWPRSNGGRFPRPPSARLQAEPNRRGDAHIAADDARINDRIRAREVFLVDADGTQLGVRPLPEALAIAGEQELDLVEVAANANPPVCRILNYGRYKYEQEQRRKESRKRATNVVVKEMKFRPKIDSHDYTTKMKHVERFLAEGSKVKLTIMFRGREMAHPELGRRILTRVAEQVAELATVESSPRQDGRNMTMVLNPTRRPKGKGQGAAKGARKSGDHEGPAEETPAEATA